VPAPLRLVLTLTAALSLLVALPQDGLAKKRHHHRRGGCSKFCRQAGGFGAGPETKVPVRIPRQTIRPDDGLFGVRARCTLEHGCDGAILVNGHSVEYGRADLRIPEDRTRTVWVRLSRAGRRYLKKHHRDRQVFAAVALKGNHPASFSKRLTLVRNDR
jgi:hypothetical protein